MANLGTFKLALVGSGNVGKTSMVKMFVTNEYQTRYIPTIGVEVHPLRFKTNYGTIVFNVWDCAGVNKYRGLEDGYYIKSNCAIIMFDEKSIGLKEVPKYITKLTKKHKIDSKNIVICKNKLDLNSNVHINSIVHSTGCYCKISVKSRSNLEDPFLYLARELTNKPDLVFN